MEITMTPQVKIIVILSAAISGIAIGYIITRIFPPLIKRIRVMNFRSFYCDFRSALTRTGLYSREPEKIIMDFVIAGGKIKLTASMNANHPNEDEVVKRLADLIIVIEENLENSS